MQILLRVQINMPFEHLPILWMIFHCSLLEIRVCHPEKVAAAKSRQLMEGRLHSK
jgi:hypothetical protein